MKRVRIYKDNVCERGFSLIELLIALVIISVLVSIAVPGYLRARFDMTAKKAEFNLNQIYNAQKAYWIDNVDGVATGCSYAGPGEDASLRKYIDCLLEADDGQWYYQLLDASGTGTTATFSAYAYYVEDPSIQLIIDQTGNIERRNWPH